MKPELIPLLLKQLKSVGKSGDVENPYHSVGCRKNLKAYLNSLCKNSYSGHLLVGEAPGYKGCAITGIPFTSQRVLLESSHPFLERLRPSLSVQSLVTESTATIVWDYLDECTSVPAMWNVFPFHPHKSGNLSSNRKPTKQEVRSGHPFLQLVLDILSPHTILSVGNISKNTMGELFPAIQITTVRHPSFGGKSDFIDGIRSAGIL